MFPGIGTIINSVGVLVVGFATRVLIGRELGDFEKNIYIMSQCNRFFCLIFNSGHM